MNKVVYIGCSVYVLGPALWKYDLPRTELNRYAVVS